MPHQNLRLLLVDDDAEDLSFLQFSFSSLVPAASVLVFTDAMEALKSAIADSAVVPDLVVVDYNMPRINGLEFIKRLRLLPQLQKVPVVMYSTDIRHITQEQSEAYQFLPMNKGNTLDELQRSCQQMLHWLHQRQRSATAGL